MTSDAVWSDRFGDVGQPAESTGLSAVAVSGADVYVGGTFTALNLDTPVVSANHVAHWNGRGWSALGTPSANGVDGIVRAIAILGSSVYVGGDFSTAGGVPASRVARWNGSSWKALGAGVTDTPGSSTSGLTVTALTVSGSILYVGGTFDVAGTATGAHSIAAWNGTLWSALGTGVMDCCGGAGSVKAIVVSGSKLYLGGAFAKVGSVLTSGIAQWNGTSWSALPVGGSGAQSQFQFVRGTVNALALSGSTLYAGGDFASISGVTASSVASWNGTSWSALGAGISGGGGTAVQALTVFAGKLFAGGTFTNAGGQAVIAQWNGAAWSAVGAGLAGAVNAFAVSPSGVVVGGLFSGSGTTTLQSIGTWTGAAWTAFGLGASSGRSGGYLTTLAASGRDLYAGGAFSTAGSTAVSNVAHFNGSRWDAMGGGVTGGTPFAVAINGSQVYVGGSFSRAGTGAASHIAMWDGSAWHGLGSGTDGLVKALLVYNGKLWVGGTFAHAGSKPASNVATWNPTTHAWAPVGGNIGYDGSSPPVNALTGITDPAHPANNHYVIIGGGFASVTDGAKHVAANSLLLFDTTAAITGPFSGYYTFPGTAAGSVGVTSGCCAGSVFALYADRLKVYVGGDFDVAGSVASRGFALFNLAAGPFSGWSSVGTVGGAIPGIVNAITKVGTSLYVAGDFSTAGRVSGPVSAADVAQYTPATDAWAPLGSGLSEASFSSATDGATGLAQSADGLYVGGGFSTAGAKPSQNLALWSATAAPPTLSSFTPTSGKAAVTAVTINGSSFWGATTVTFNGRSASFKILSGTQIMATTPTAATSGKIAATTPRGTATSAVSFSVTP